MTKPDRRPGTIGSSLAPVGRLGFRGRQATPEERARVFDALFFEGDQRVPYLQQFFVLMVLSAAIAAFGLINDSAAVVIGAMLVAPLMTPILATAAAIVEGWSQRSVDSLVIVGAGALTGIGVGFAVGVLAPSLHNGLPLPGELLGRTAPNLIDLFIALAAGAAAGFVAVRTEASGALPGVGIAVALVPPLATVGITAGVGAWNLSLGALLLFATNLVAIILAAGLVLVGAGFAAFLDERGQRYVTLASRLLWVGLIIVLVPLAYRSWDLLQQTTTQAEAVRDARDWAEGLTVERVELDRSSEPALVRVSVTGTDGPPDPSALAGLIAEDLQRAVKVEVIWAPVLEGSAPAP